MVNSTRRFQPEQLKDWNEAKPRPCSRCSEPITTGDRFVDRAEGFRRLCEKCAGEVRNLRSVITANIARQDRAREAEHIAAVKFARMTSDLL